MKNLNIFLKLLLFPFLFFIRSSLFQNKMMDSQKNSERGKKQILFVIFSSFFIVTSLWAPPAPSSNSPDISIDPTAKSIIVGTTPVTLNVNLSEAGNKDSIVVTYEHDCTGSTTTTGTVTIAQGDTQGTISVDTSTLTGGDTCSVTLTGATGNGNGSNEQQVGNIDPDTSTITVISSTTPASDLNITKTSSAAIVTINREFYYTINVGNAGNDTATNVIVVDTLPEEIKVIDIDQTNDDSNTSWACTDDAPTSPITVTCKHNDSNISAGEIHTITLHVTAPLSSDTIINNVTVFNTTDINDTNTSSLAQAETTITNELENVDDLCYFVHEPIGGTDCDAEGNFWYGNGCETSVTIYDTNVSDIDLTGLVVTKMYAPSLDHGTATTTLGNIRGGGISSLAITEYTSYTEGYIVDIDALLASDGNFTLTDEDSYNNGNRMYGISFYADYNISVTDINGLTGNEHHTGRIYACSGGEGGIEILSGADIIDTLITDVNVNNYNSSSVPNSPRLNATDLKFIRTMIADDNTRNIVGVYLDLDDHSTVYDYNGSGNTLLPYKITPIWSDSTCSTYLGNVIDPDTNQQLIIEIPSGSYSAIGKAYVPNKVRKDSRLQMIAIDPNALSVEGQNCLDGSTTGNFLQLAQCVNSEVQYKTAFGQDAWDRCGLDSGLPCTSSNHGAANPVDPTYDPDEDFIYLNDLGCYMCTFNIQPSCSSDNFAIRPKAFDVNVSDGDIFISGQDINLKFEAENWNDVTETYDYNETENSSFSVDINITDDTKSCPVTVDLNPSVNFSDGIVIDNFFFNDIGKDLNFTVSEINGSEYALVDYDDTNDTDRFITPLERNITVIPDLFEINATLTDHNDINNFTYLHDINKYESHDNYEMGAELNISIYALGADGNITRNYMETCYAKDTNITLVLSGTSITYPGSQPLEYFLYYNPAEANGTTDSGEGNYTLPAPVGNTITLPSLPIENIPSTFPADAPEGNGTTQILYKLNFDRKQNLVVNPFQIILDDVNITEIDATVAPADLVTGDTGTLTGQAATMYYARTRASKFFYEDITEPSVTTPILVDIYCDLGFSACDTFDINTTDAGIEDPDWWLSLGHSETIQNDGNITLIINLPAAIIEGNGTPVVDTDVTVDSLGKDDSISVTSNATKLPMTVIIDLDETNPTDTNHWLIYNPNDAITAPTPFYKVRFIGKAKWTGEGKTGHVIDVNASYKKSLRVDW